MIVMRMTNLSCPECDSVVYVYLPDEGLSDADI